MATFLLLHGGSHQGWHWRLVRPLLEARGHRTVAPTLPMYDTTKGAADWADVAAGAVKDLPDDEALYVVAHSYSGLCLPLVASRVPVKRMVFLCAQVPTPGVSFNASVANKPYCMISPADQFEWDEQGRLILPFEVAHGIFFPDAEEEAARASHGKLLPSSLHVLDEPSPLDVWPDVPSTYIVGTTDAVIGPEWGREVSLESLGGPAIEIEGDHSPFLNRPNELADILVGLVEADSVALSMIEAR